MPVFLKRNEDRKCLYVSIGKMDKAAFQDVLARVKSTPGRRPNPNGPGDKFVWEFPDNAQMAMRLMTSLTPVADSEIEDMVRKHAAEVAGQLITQIGDDAELQLPYADKLYPFQRSGVDFMATHPMALLSDEMGLGKTLEAITAIEEFYLRNPASPDNDYGSRSGLLTICPKAVRGTWASELEHGPMIPDPEHPDDNTKRIPLIPDWTPIPTQIVDGRTPKIRQEQIANPDAEAFIINWESFWREPIIDLLAKRKWRGVIADEAHRAKNRKAKQARGLYKLHAPVQIAATGTPIMNSPDELWSLLHWLYPKAYTSFWAFHNAYVDEYIGGFNRRVMVGVRDADALRFELTDKMIRRRKTDVLKDLPPKLPPQIIEVELTTAQRKLYVEAETALFLDLAEFIKNENQGASPAAVEKLAEEMASMPMDKLTAMVPNAGARIAKLRQITAAAKVAVADELIREEPDTPVVAFTWHVDAARQLALALAKGPQGLRVGTIAGSDDADPVKDDFQAGNLDHVVCTISKGGTGLTLTRSSNPLMVEEDWTPAINDQAIDRTHRVGQTDPVTPRVLRCTNTVDDGRVAPRNAFKRAITAQIIGG
jgi:SNF2 family DNA or RNA helicase